jgi:hypothetical protein
MQKQIELKLFTEQEQASVGKYSAFLSNIHQRLAIEGYFLPGGKIWNIFKAGTIVGEVVWEE